MVPTEEVSPILVICGPTGVGKSHLALRLAVELDAEIVSADTGQVYRGLDIGTAKPSAADRQHVPHHGFDLFQPNEQGDVAQYAERASAIVAEILSRGKKVFVVGGAGLYLKALLHGIVPLPGRDGEIRGELESMFETHGGDFLHRQLKEIDPEAARRIHPNDPVRLVRALEVYRLTGKTISTYQSDHRFFAQRYQALKIGLNRDRVDLYRRIEARVDVMLGQGWLEEVREIIGQYGEKAPALHNIGYRELAAQLRGELEWEACRAAIKKKSRRYAKRQLTWFRRDPEIVWYHPEEYEQVKEKAYEFYDL